MSRVSPNRKHTPHKKTVSVQSHSNDIGIVTLRNTGIPNQQVTYLVVYKSLCTYTAHRYIQKHGIETPEKYNKNHHKNLHQSL